MSDIPPSSSESQKEYDNNAIFHWSDLLPAGFVQFLEQADLLGDTPDDVLEKLDEIDISPRLAEQCNVREGRARIERIVEVIDNGMYMDEDNTSIEEILSLFFADVPENLRKELQNILQTHLEVTTLADIHILGEEALHSRRLPQDVFSSDALKSLYDIHVIPLLIRHMQQAKTLFTFGDDEEDEDNNGQSVEVHHHHYPKRGISIFTASIAMMIFALVAKERGYIDIHKQPIRHDIKAVLHTVQGWIHQVFSRD